MTKKITVFVGIAIMATMFFGGTAIAPAFAGGNAASTVTINTKTPMNLVIFVPCANEGLGENVHLQGTLHSIFHITQNDNGITVNQANQPQRVSGYGLTTGDLYQGTGVTRNTTHVDDVLNETFVNNFRIIGQGPDNNYLVHTTSHFTFNANGDLSADVLIDSVECN